MKRLMPLLLASIIFVGCAAQSTEAELMDQTIIVETAAVEKGTLEKENTYIGKILDTETVTVIPRVSGDVTDILVAEGDYVNAGDVLFTIDDEQAKLSLASAKLDQASAQAGITNAAITEQDTIDKLNNQKVLNLVNQEGNLEEIENQIANAKLTVQQNQNQIEQYEDQRSAQKGNRNAAENEIKRLEDAISALGDSDPEAKALLEVQLSTAKANLRSAESQVKSLDTTIENMGMSVQTARNSLKSLEEKKQAILNANLVTNTETDRSMNVTQNNLEIQKQTAAISADKAAVAVDNAELTLSFYQVGAPISGIVEDVLITEKNKCSPEGAALIITNPSSRSVEFEVSGDVKNEMSMGQEVRVVDSDNVYYGAVTEIALAVNETTGLFTVKAALNNAEGLANGTRVELYTKSHKVTEAFLVPADAIYFEDGTSFVYVMKDGTATKREVEIALYDKEQMALGSGVEAGEEVITSWSASLKDGAKVTKE